MTFTPTRRLLLTILVLVLWGLGTHGTHAGTGDEPHYLAIAHSLAFDGDLDLGNNYGADEPLIMSGALDPAGHRRQGADGTLRPIHDVGLPIIIAPYVRLAVPLTTWLASHVPESLMRRARLNPTILYRHILSFAMIALAAVLAGVMFDTFIRLGASARSAFWFTLLLMASPPLLVYSTLLFTELVSALLVFVVFYYLVVRPAMTPAMWLIMGVITGFLLLVHARNIGLILGLSVVAAIRARQSGRWRPASAYGLGLMVMILARTLLNHHLWGTWVTTPHASAGPWPGWNEVSRVSALRMLALLVDQEYGLFLYAPVYLLVIAGLPGMFKRIPQIGIAVLVIGVSYLLPVLSPVTNVHGWSGQWCPAGRFLTPVLPLCGLAVYFAYGAARWPAICLIALQVTISAYLWQHPKLLWNDGDGRAAYCSRLGDRLCEKLPSLAPTVH